MVGRLLEQKASDGQAGAKNRQGCETEQAALAGRARTDAPQLLVKKVLIALIHGRNLLIAKEIPSGKRRRTGSRSRRNAAIRLAKAGDRNRLYEAKSGRLGFKKARFF